MKCEQVRQLFDAYLDGELSPSQTTEVGAHCLKCINCRRALALLEVSGHIIANDGDDVQVSGNFSDRLLACIGGSRAGWTQWLRRAVYYGGPMAAAAVIGLAFLGAFDRHPSGEARVLGQKEIAPDVRALEASGPHPVPPAEASQGPNVSIQTNRWLHGLQNNMATVEQLNLTVLQWMEFLNELRQLQEAGERDSGPAIPNPPPTPDSDEDEPDSAPDVEDL